MIYGSYQFVCKFESEAVLPEYKGSTFRGVFGSALRQVTCPLRHQECGDCLLRYKCVYPGVFHAELAASPGDSPGKSSTPPPPLVIEPPDSDECHFAPGDAFSFKLLLFGAINDNLPYFVYAFEQTGRLGIGKKVGGRRASFALKAVKSAEGIIYTPESGILELGETSCDLLPPAVENKPEQTYQDMKVVLKTPLRVKYKNRLVSELPFHVFFRACLRRIAEIYNHYGEGEPAWDYSGLIAGAQKVRTRKDELTWWDWERFSGRQKEKMKFGGLTGSVVYADVPVLYWPVLELAQKLHVGKQTIFGLGAYAIFPEKG